MRVVVVPKWSVNFATKSGFPEFQDTLTTPFIMFEDPSYLLCIEIIEHMTKTIQTEHIEIVNLLDGRMVYMKGMDILFKNFETIPGINLEENERRQYLSFELDENIKRNRKEAGLVKT
jgi:hypothetical protein